MEKKDKTEKLQPGEGREPQPPGPRTRRAGSGATCPGAGLKRHLRAAPAAGPGRTRSSCAHAAISVRVPACAPAGGALRSGGSTAAPDPHKGSAGPASPGPGPGARGLRDWRPAAGWPVAPHRAEAPRAHTHAHTHTDF